MKSSVECGNRRHCQTTLGDFRPRGSVIGGEPATEGPPTKNLECRLAVSSVSTLRAQFRTGRRHEEFLNVYVCVVACCLWARAVCGCLCVLRYVRQTTVSSLPSQQQLNSHGSSQTFERGEFRRHEKDHTACDVLMTFVLLVLTCT